MHSHPTKWSQTKETHSTGTDVQFKPIFTSNHQNQASCGKHLVSAQLLFESTSGSTVLMKHIR